MECGVSRLKTLHPPPGHEKASLAIRETSHSVERENLREKSWQVLEILLFAKWA